MTIEFLDGTYDRKETQTRQVWCNGILAMELRRDLLDEGSYRDGYSGKPHVFNKWGTYPDLKTESLK